MRAINNLIFVKLLDWSRLIFETLLDWSSNSAQLVRQHRRRTLASSGMHVRWQRQGYEKAHSSFSSYAAQSPPDFER